MLYKVESSSKNVPQVDGLKAFTDKIYSQIKLLVQIHIFNALPSFASIFRARHSYKNSMDISQYTPIFSYEKKSIPFRAKSHKLKRDTIYIYLLKYSNFSRKKHL